MKAIILAAGQGTRLRPLTDDRPKCLVELGGMTLLDRQMLALKEAGINDISVVVGYRGDLIEKKGFKVFYNPEYETTNMVRSFFAARDLLKGDSDILILYGDIVYEPQVIQKVLDCRDPFCLAIDLAWRDFWSLRFSNPLSDAETLKVDPQGFLTEIGRKPKSYDEIEGQYVGIIKVSAALAPKLEEIYLKLADGEKKLFDGKDHANMFMTSFLQHLVDIDWKLKIVPIRNGWLETDSVDDLNCFEKMLEDGTLKKFYNFPPVNG